MPETSLRVQGELAKFSVESGLAEAMRTWRLKAVYETNEWQRFMAQIPSEIVKAK